MNLITAIVHNPVKVTVGVLLTVLFGLVALTRMPMQLTPEVQRPTITVETRWPGASPQEVEREIVLEQEEQLKSVEGITKLSSESADSKGTITLEFLVGTNMDEALLKVNSRLQQVPEYPEDADQPIISTANAADRPIAWFILSSRLPDKEKILAFGEKHPELKERLEVISKTPNPGLAMLRLRLLSEEYPDVRGEILPQEDIEVTKLRRFAEDEIEARFERVAGVSQSNVLGGLEEELQVVVDSEQLAARQLTIADVRRVLRGQNADTSAGDFWEGKRRWVVRTLGQFRNIEEVEDQLLAIRDGAPVYVRDVAEVRLGYKKPDGLVRRFGESSIAVNCIRETGANVLEIMNGLRDAAQDIDETVLKPRGLQLVQVYDETDYIYSSVDLVKNNIFIGGALTMIVLMSFLHLGIRTLIVVPFIILTAVAAAYISPWFFAVCLALIVGAGFWFARGALVVGLAIPTSIIGTFLILGLMGRSLNVISLAGLAFAVGMLVDNAVVVLENIFRRYSLGESPFRAAIKGTQEVWGAVLASTLTTIAVFLPVVFIQEEAGQLFQDIALAISAAVGLSLLVSMTLISTASARLLHKREGQDIEDMRVVDNPEPEEPQHKGALHRLIIGPIESGGALFVKTVVGMNHWIQQGLLRRLVVTAVLVGAAFGISWQLWPKVEYLPTGNRNLIFCILLPPPGYNLNQLMELGETVESDLRPYWDIVDPGSDEAQKLDYPVIGDFFFVARGRMVFMGIRAYDSQRVGELIPLVQRAGMKLPGTFAVAKQSSLFEQGLTGGRTVEVEIIGPDLKKLVGMGGQILGQVKGMIPDAQVRPIPSLDLSSPEVHIEPKLVQAADMGVSSADLGYMVNALVDGAYAGDYYLGGDKIDLSIVGESRHIQNTQDVQALSVATPIGNLVSLDALAKVEITSGPEQVNHRERQRAITIEVSPPEAMALEDAMQQIQDKIVQPMRESGQLAGGYRIMLSGTADKLRDTWAALQFNVLLALMITYLLMAALFESWLYPFVIIFSVPLGAVGGILGLSILNLFMLQTLDVLTMLGFVILIGTVVNNPILIIHQSLNHINEDGMTPREAILESIRTRIRPIFMTTTTTVLGLLPLVLFPGAGSELYRGLGSVVLGGLIVSTLFTLVLVPTLFSLTMDAKQSVVNLLRPGVVSQLKAKAATASDVDSQEKENVSV
ncbi:efflux RND transporter permease subunit [Gimesia panareensis]|uniref:efflux RND transporter permease subunit n=1 Tax=Gimesia panareensis TaxID=2527978 RepID=UPI00118C2839|nr:efflux RND transporter permease subunit [Gimesia panareensis]QDU51155.1 Efflux pump membrane transporter BepE [Gimesia panareensis]